MSSRPELTDDQQEVLTLLVEWAASEKWPPDCWYSLGQPPIEIEDKTGARSPLTIPHEPVPYLKLFADLGWISLITHTDLRHTNRLGSTYGYSFRLRQEAHDHARWLHKSSPLKWLDRQLESGTKQQIIVGAVLLVLSCILGIIAARLADPILDKIAGLLFLSPLP